MQCAVVCGACCAGLTELYGLALGEIFTRRAGQSGRIFNTLGRCTLYDDCTYVKICWILNFWNKVHPEYDKKTKNNQMIKVTQIMKPKDYWIMLVQNWIWTIAL